MSATSLSELRAAQLAFWTAFAETAANASITTPKPAAKNWCYLPLGTSRAKIVLAVSFRDGWVACKLALAPSELRKAKDLAADRAAIERELGFCDIVWGAPTPTRVYRQSAAAVGDRQAWPEAFRWLMGTAAAFKKVFVPRLTDAQERTTGSSSRDRLTTPSPSQRRPDDHRPSGCRRTAAQLPTQPAARQPVASALTISACFQSLATDCDLAVREGSHTAGDLPNGASWLALYSREGEPVHRYAFALWWGEEPTLSTTVAWVLLNPATGDTDGKPRPILTRCRHQSEDLGHTGLIIVNLFAYRDRDPKKLKALDAMLAVGPHNNRVLTRITSRCARTIAAWGAGGAMGHRSSAVRPFLNNPQCLPKNDHPVSGNGEPFYPKGVKLDAQPIALPPPPAASPKLAPVL